MYVHLFNNVFMSRAWNKEKTQSLQGSGCNALTMNALYQINSDLKEKPILEEH